MRAPPRAGRPQLLPKCTWKVSRRPGQRLDRHIGVPSAPPEPSIVCWHQTQSPHLGASDLLPHPLRSTFFTCLLCGVVPVTPRKWAEGVGPKRSRQKKEKGQLFKVTKVPTNALGGGPFHGPSTCVGSGRIWAGGEEGRENGQGEAEGRTAPPGTARSSVRRTDLPPGSLRRPGVHRRREPATFQLDEPAGPTCEAEGRWTYSEGALGTVPGPLCPGGHSS